MNGPLAAVASEQLVTTSVTHVVLTGAQLSGREALVADLARAQNAQPSKSATVLTSGANGVADLMRRRGANVRNLSWFALLRTVRRIRPRPDALRVLHAHGVRALLLASVRRRGVVAIYSNHGFVETTLMRRTLLFLEPLLHRFADHIVLCSPHQVTRLSGRTRRPIHLVPNAVAPGRRTTETQRAAARIRFGVQDRTPVIGIVGRLAPEKRHDVFLHTAAHVVRHHPRAALLIAGTGPEEAALRTLATELGLSDHVRFPGHVGDISEVHGVLDLLLHTSDTEGMPLAVIEAMAAGTPVVATAVGGVPHLLGDGRHGVLVSPGSPGPLADAAIDVLADSDRRRAMAQRAQRYAASQLSLDRMCADLDTVYAQQR